MSTRTSYTQFSVMIDFMEKNGDLSKPTGGPRERQWCIQKWRELTEKLNSEGTGESRTEEKWRKVWSDLKNNTKEKWAKINRSVQGTGGGPALKMCLTDLEHRVMAIVGVQAATGMPMSEIGFGQEVEIIQVANKTEEVLMLDDQTPIYQDEYWNTPGTSTDPILRIPSPKITIPPRSTMPHKSPKLTTPPRSPLQSTSPQRPSPQKKKKLAKSLENLFIKCEMNAREDNRERERVFVDLERERIRQRDTELQLQAQWLEFMKEALRVFEKYMDKK